MRIEVAQPNGFCYGVRRALALGEAAANSGGAATLGPIVHNPHVVSYLAQRGVIPVNSVAESPHHRLLIRAHGVPQAVLEEARQAGCEIIDATCPFVSRAQAAVRQLASEGRLVLIIGQSDHPEVIALMDAASQSKVIQQISEVDECDINVPLGVIAQTTQSKHLVKAVLARLEERKVPYRAIDTICEETEKRQAAMRRLAGDSDVVIVVGGKNSSNTRKLAQIARECGRQSYVVESACDVEPEWISEAEVVGIAAGASTPDWITKEVIGKVEELEKKLIPTGEEPQEEERAAGEEVESVDAAVDTCCCCASDEDGEQAGDSCCQEPAVESECCAPCSCEEEPAVESECCAPCSCEEEPAAENKDCAPDSCTEEPTTIENECCVPCCSEEVVESPAEVAGDEEMEATPSQDEIYEDAFRVLEVGEIVEGKVVSVDDTGVLVDVGYKSEGLIPAQEFSRQHPASELQPGDDIKVYVSSIDGQEGALNLSKQRAEEEVAWETLQQAMDGEDTIEAEVVQEVKGGLVVDIGLRGFVPASQVERGYVSDLSKYVGQKLRLRPIELDRQKNRAILSQRLVLEEEYEHLREETWATIEEGQVRAGVVKGITDFGVFVDLGGVDGLLHVSELSWGRVKHPSDVVKEGQPIDVMVLRVDREKGKISLGLKQILDDPWVRAEEKYSVDAIVEGRVTRLAPFGAFVELEEGVEGLVHISEMADRHIAKPEEVVSVDQVVQVKVLRVRSQDRRISLSIKETLEDKAPPQDVSSNMSSGEGSGNLTIGDMFGDLLEERRERFATNDEEEDEK